MDDSMLLSMVIGIGVIVLVGGLGLVMSGSFSKLAEQRLEGLTGAGGKRTREQLAHGILLRPSAINLGTGSLWAKLVPNPENLNLLYEQADVNLTFNSFMALVLGLGSPRHPLRPVLPASPLRHPCRPRAFWAHSPSSGCSSESRSGSRSSSRPCPRPSS